MIRYRDSSVFFFLITTMLMIHPIMPSAADGGYFSRGRSIAVSADQRAILVVEGTTVSMTLSTGYTGTGDDFAWIIPTPNPPKIEDVREGTISESLSFSHLDEITSPKITVKGSGGSCFPPGTSVLTEDGPIPIEKVSAGTHVWSCDVSTGTWKLQRVLTLLTHRFEGDMITVQTGNTSIQATGNHPFFIHEGNSLNRRREPADVPRSESKTSNGRWVEARELEAGDILAGVNGKKVQITGVKTRQVDTDVYNLTVSEFHTYAVGSAGFLVHNKGKGEATDSGAYLSEGPPVEVYGTAVLDNFEVSVLGATGASALLNWLDEHEYRVDKSAEEIIDAYIDEKWAFVAVKLRLEGNRQYQNESLPPLTITFQSNEIIFPLRISSVSTKETVPITLYVVTESTVKSTNFHTASLIYESVHDERIDPEHYIIQCIESTLQEGKGRALAKIWSGPFEGDKYLTRLETRLGPESMVEDIRFSQDTTPESFSVSVKTPGFFSHLVEAVREADVDAVEYYLVRGISVDASDEDGMTALTEAARRGHLDIVTLLIEAGANIDVFDSNGDTPLTAAVRSEHADIVLFLIDQGVELNGNNSPLSVAAETGNMEIAQICIEAGADVNVGLSTGNLTPIRNAARYGNTEIVKLLIREGAEIDTEPIPPISMAARYGHTDTVRLFVEEGADIDAGASPAIEAAALMGHTDTVKYLIETGAVVDNRNTSQDNTALMSAASKGHTNIVRILAQAGAEIDLINRQGVTALTLASWKGHTETALLLLQKGADITQSGNSVALVWAASRGYLATVMVLCDAGIDVNLQVADGTTALIWAVRQRNLNLVQYLVEKGANVNLSATDGSTALMWASRVGRIEIVKYLVGAGADINAKDNEGRTAFDHVDEKRHMDISKFLKNAGVKE